ncbi:MAG: hypothetical protein IJJ29_10510 [Solobacterium sp.]|nr:hypothetical protein [Solobacterium sp.]
MLNKYLIKNGTILSVVDGSQKKADIRVSDGKITRIAEDLIPEHDEEVINASGMMITTGWVDAHCHVGEVGDGIGIDPIKHVLCQGVTYIVEPGTAGADNFGQYRENLRYRSDLHYQAYLNMGSHGISGIRVMDTEGPQDVDEEKIRKVYNKYRDEIKGLKIRIDNKFCFDPEYMLKCTRKLADELGCSIMVHAPRCKLPLAEVLSYLKDGDVLAHTLSGKTENMRIFDPEGNVRSCVPEARERGVLLDLAHGTNAFSYEIGEKAWSIGFFTDMISSDMHHNNVNGPVYSFASVISKMHGMTGLPWLRILQYVTVDPVRKMRLPGKELEIREGDPADLTVFRIEKGSFTYEDSENVQRTYDERIHVRYTCFKDRIYVNDQEY